MGNSIKYITPVEDCSYIDIEHEMAMCINNCFTNQNVFKISNTVNEDELPLLAYDYKTRKWLTGRYIGKLFFQYKKKNYCFEVKPRFGNATIMHLLEEIFNIKLAQSNTSNALNNKAHNELIKKLISFIWVKQLSKANVHGLPKNKIKKHYKSSNVKGRIDVRKSILPIYNENLIVSRRIEKQLDATILSIIYKSYQILCKHYFLTQNMLTDNVKEIIHSASGFKQKPITINQYQSIKYGSMYTNYKSIVDFSWNIIQRKRNSISQEHSNNTGDALFLDMAEIWEMYLMTILKKKYGIEGWKVYSQKFSIYNQQDYKRGIIPDLIIEKNNNVVVFDAKYKRMENSGRDYDRKDFFQIHTYGSFMKARRKNLIGIGLLYPFKEIATKEQIGRNFSSGLFGENDNNTWFKVDGITLADKVEDLTLNKDAFLSRFSTLLYANNN